MGGEASNDALSLGHAYPVNDISLAGHPEVWSWGLSHYVECFGAQLQSLLLHSATTLAVARSAPWQPAMNSQSLMGDAVGGT